MKHANFEVLESTPDRVTLRDLGPWDKHPTITNDAEWVVKTLFNAGIISEDKRLFYHDSEGSFDYADELLFDGPVFKGFSAGKRNA